MKYEVYLLDIDNVLIDPGGYRESFSSTMNYFLRRMEWSNVDSHDLSAEIFEAYGITNEWDMIAICLSRLFVTASHHMLDVSFPSDVSQALDLVLNSDIPKQRVNFSQLAREVGLAIQSTSILLPTLVAYKLLARFDNDTVNSLIKHILFDARDIRKSLTMKIFQNFAIGSVNFNKTYGIEAPFEQASLIVDKDVSVLSSDNADRLTHVSDDSLVRPVIYTARPSLPPDGKTDSVNYYSPEAELAVQLVGLDSLPLIGSGRTDWLAFKTGGDPNACIKPGLVHALASIGAAISRDEEASLISAYKFFHEGELNYPLSMLVGTELSITVFEDSARNIESVKNALDLLYESGISSSFTAKGIAVNEEKRSVLMKSGAMVFSDINEAIGS